LCVEGYSYNGEIAKWLSDFLDRENLDLVCFGEGLEPRRVNLINEKFKGRETDAVFYNDYTPFMLIGQNSLNELNKRMQQMVPMKNFRPNFVIYDSPAFAEVRLLLIISAFMSYFKNLFLKDNWKHFAVNGCNFLNIRHTTR
jgi:uncharacterized protein YcbX